MGATKKSQINPTTNPKSKLQKKNLLEKNQDKRTIPEVNVSIPPVDSKLIKSKTGSKSSIEKKLETIKTVVQNANSQKLLKSTNKTVSVQSKKSISTKKQCGTIVKPVEKSKAINKMLKSLDIKITGFPNFLSETKIVDCSISENVKTKYRAVKTSAGPTLHLKSSTKKDEISADVEKVSSNKLDDESVSIPEISFKRELNTANIEPKSDEGVPIKEIGHTTPPIIENFPENSAMGRKNNEIVIKPIKKISVSAVSKKSKTEKLVAKVGKSTSSKDSEKTKTKDTVKEAKAPLKDGAKKAVRKYVRKNTAEKELSKSQEKETKTTLKQTKTISKKTKDLSNISNVSSESKKQNTEKINLPSTDLIQNKKTVKKTTVKKEKSTKAVNNNKKDCRNISIKSTKPDEEKYSNKEINQITTDINTKLENEPKVKNDIDLTDVKQITVTEKAESDFSCNINNKEKDVNESKSENELVKLVNEQEKKVQEDVATKTLEEKSNVNADLDEEKESVQEAEKYEIFEAETKLDPKFQTVRERLQKKYVATFKVNPESNILQVDPIPLAQKRSAPTKISVEPNKSSKKSDMDIYDFKSESETEETIKMNLLDPICKKTDQDNALDLEKESDTVKENDSINNSENVEIKSDVKAAEEKISIIKKKKPEKKAIIKNSVPKKKVVKKSKSGTESDSENEPSSKKRKKVPFVQKRHRMASLNALAKVQCLYENESRTAHELGLYKTTQIPKMRTIQSGESSEDEKNEGNNKDKLKEKNKVEADDNESEKSEVEEIVTKRELRNVPGTRGAGWHWDYNDCSSYESADESDADASYRQEGEVSKSKSKKKKLQKLKVVKVIKAKFSKLKANKKSEKAKLKKKTSQISCDDDSETSVIKKEPAEKIKKKKLVYKKRKHKDEYLLTLKGLARKRMASLNASAIVAATYELEGHLDRNLNSECSSYDSLDEKKKQKNITPFLKKTKEAKKEVNKNLTVSEDVKENKDTKDSSRPTSSSVVIVQDTDVTITGVYVNSSTGSSQEAYCKMQYRVQSSVTEERVLRPNSIDPPPKSYTPLGALSSMLPPNTINDGQQTNQSLSTIQAPISTAINQQQQQQQHLQPPIQPSTEHITGNIYGAQGHLHHSHSLQQQQLQHHHHHHSQHPDNTTHIYPPAHPISSSHIGHYGNGMSYDNSQYQYHHLNSGNVSSLPQHLQHHVHHYSQQQPSGRCDSPSAMQYHLQPSQSQGNGYQQSGSIMGPPPPLSSSGLGSAQSAFCAPNVQQQPQSHHDLSGYYQPAGPLISPHVISATAAQTQSQPSSVSSGLLVPGSNIKQNSVHGDSDSEQQQLLQQPPQSTSAAESTDSDVLITGGDLSTFRYPPSIVSSQQQQNSGNANSTAGQLSVLATAAAQQQAAVAAAAVAANNAYSRSMHQMHYPSAYPPSYYSPYPGDMCYTPSYQPYFPTTKVYPSTQYHRRYPAAAYYPPGPTPSSSDLYDSSVTPSLVTSGQSPVHQPQSQAPSNATSQLVPMGSTGPPHQQQPLPLTQQHIDHYPGPPGFYSGYGPSGPSGSRGAVTAQCYSRGIQPSYLEYPPACPCPMQSCPKNVLTGPLIGSSSSNGNNSSSLANHNNSQNNSNNNTKNNSSSSTMMNSDIKIMNSSNNNSGNNSLIMNSQHNSIKNTSTITSNSSNNTTTSSLNHVHHPHSSINNISSHQQPLKANNVGPVKKSNSNNHLNGHHHHICKMEIIDSMSPPPTTIPTQTTLKSELKTEITEINTSEKSYKNNEYEDIIIEPPTPPPSANGGVLIGGGYTVNEKLMEPDMTISPARGSTGLPTEPDQSDKAAIVTSSAANMKTITSPTETNFGSFAFSNVQGSVRKPRLGKAMVREYIYNSASVAAPITNTTNAIHLPQSQMFGNPQHPFVARPSPNHIEPSVTEDSQLSSTSLIDLSSPNNLAHTVNNISESSSIIKKEQIKKETSEDEDVVVILDDEQHHKIKTEQPDEIFEVFDDRSNEDQLLSETPPRRIKILELKSTKKSPQNGYKSLIKQTEPRPYLCLSRKPEKKDRFGKYIKNSSRGSGVRKRKLVLTEQQKTRLKQRKKKLKQMEQEKMEKELNKKDKALAADLFLNTDENLLKDNNKNESPKDDNDIYSEVKEREENLKTPLDITIDLVSRGYFSEPEVRAAPSNKKAKNSRKKNCTNKIKSEKGRSQSETKKSSKTKEHTMSRKVSQASSNSIVSMRANINSSASEDSLEAFCKAKFSKKTISKKVRNKSKSKKSVVEISNDNLGNNNVSDPVIGTNNNFLEYAPQTDNVKSNKKSSKVVQNNVPNNKPINEINTISDKIVTMETTITNESLSTSTSPPLMAHPELLLPTKEYFEEIFGRSKPQKRKTNKGRQRFSRTKKRRILSCDAAEIEIIPRKPNAIPKWNNGWHWEGEPFQGKVFLNSDDALVFRTCYPAMRHSEGDVIRPRDCVLLRAGGGAKNKELPYVAKVAHLWENPEDGEMMMSLLWYYRPEHTEQGRQPIDCSDEVFASRHRDHNSVACIEDKCYVLTYSEYCRYRRSVRGIEEGIIEKQPIVPPLQYFNPRQVPKGTNPEQVMFCQRVYEFRLKRLMKTN